LGENFSASDVADSRFLLALELIGVALINPVSPEASEVDGDISMKKPG
jgi:hypothetical protein